jgi:UDP:flavonoid glycosyltransferase YjiC (YdhE family)
MPQLRNSLNNRRIAFFISPHGFGHAARAVAVMASLKKLSPDFHFIIFTRVPEWFFADSLSSEFTYRELQTDIGMVQSSPFQEDLDKTISRLNAFYPFVPDDILNLAEQVKSCSMIVCDISPLGIEVAEKAKIPSVLVENFTWDWIYEGCLKRAPAFAPHISYLKSLIQKVAYHIQAHPFCNENPSADMRVNPISRKPRQNGFKIRKQLGVDRDRPLVFITTGGADYNELPWRSFLNYPEMTFLIPGPFKRVFYQANVIGLPVKSEFFHPDLITASDAVIGKVGYSTVAEVYHSGVPLGYIPHSSQRESEALEKFIVENMPATRIDEKAFQNGHRLHELENLLKLKRIRRNEKNGADQVAQWILNRLDNPLVPV